MVVNTGVTEIADSEEEPLTSSPGAVSDGSVDKLSATARQDDQALACNHQELAEHTANESSDHTDALDADQRKALADFSTALTAGIDRQPALQLNNHCISTSMAAAVTRAEPSPPQASTNAVTIEGRDDGGIVNAEYSESGVLPKFDIANGLAERDSTPANVQVTPTDYYEGHRHLFKLPDTHARSMRGSPPTQSPQDEALDNNPITLGFAKDDNIHASANDHSDFQGDVVMGPYKEPMDHANSEAVAESPGCDNAHEAPAVLQVSPIVRASRVHGDNENVLFQTADTSGPQDMDNSSTGAVNLASSCAETYTSEGSPALPALKTGVKAAETAVAKPIEGSAAAFVLQNCVGVTTDANEHDPASIDGRSVGLVHHRNAAGNHEERTKQKSKELTDFKSAPKQLFTDDQSYCQVPRHLPAQSGGEVSSAEEVPRLISQESATPAALPQYGSDKIDKGEMAITSQRESHSSISQASEPASPTKLSPQEITLAELRAQKAALLASLKDLPAIQLLIEENQTSDVEMCDDDGEPTEADVTAAANRIVKEHIKLLHEYNEMKDVGQGLMGLIADQRGVRIVEVQDEFGIEAND